MGRGSASKTVRRTNRALGRGTKMCGRQHAQKNGHRWTRKDALEARTALLKSKNELTQEGLNTAYNCEKLLKARGKWH